MHHFDGLTGGEPGPDGSVHGSLSADNSTTDSSIGSDHTEPLDGHATSDSAHQPIPGFEVPTAGGPHTGTVPGGIPDPALAAGVHSISSAVNVDHPVFISEQTVDHAVPEPTHHNDTMLSHAMSEWLGPAAATPVLGGAGRMAQKWIAKRRLSARTTEDLAQRLNNGERVVAVVDAEELDRHAAAETRLSELGRIPGQGAEVPVEVLSVDRPVNGAPTVSVDDDGGPVGNRTVPIEVFEAAWQLADRLAYTLQQAGPAR